MGIKEILEIIITADDKASGKLETIGGALTGVGKGVATAGAAITGATAAIGLGALKLATDAAPLVQVQGAFDGLTESFEGGSDAMLAALQKGSAGMVANAELMKSYNSAAQLVGTTFAEQLPDAMGYLGKVAGATGEDMGFMIDSLVKGVGRMSPMILDNLGIQVTLAEATANASAQFGVEADALTKTQQQAGMMNVVLEKLAANTANMPELAGSATAGFEGMKASMTNIKDELGVALLPLFNSLLETLKPLVDEMLPKLVGFIQGLSDKFAAMSPFQQKMILGLIGAAAAIGPLLLAFGGILIMAGKVITAISSIQGILAILSPALTTIGTVITGTVLPALGSVIVAALPVIAIIAAVGAAVYLLHLAWKNNFMGIQDTVKLVTDNIKAVFQAFVMILKGDWSGAMNVLKEAWNNTWDAITGRIDWIKSKIDGLTSKLTGIKLPDWLIGHSPSPFENTLVGIAQAMDSITRKTPSLDFSSMASAPSMSMARGGQSTQQSYFGGGGGGTNISITIPIDRIDSRVDVDEMAWKVIERIKQVTGR